MEKDSRKEVSRMLAQLQQDLQSLRSHQSSRYSENHPYAVELEYYLTRLSTALNVIAHPAWARGWVGSFAANTN